MKGQQAAALRYGGLAKIALVALLGNVPYDHGLNGARRKSLSVTMLGWDFVYYR